MLIVLVLLICAFMHDVLPLSVSSVDKGDEFLMNLQNILSEFSRKSDTGELLRIHLPGTSVNKGKKGLAPKVEDPGFLSIPP